MGRLWNWAALCVALSVACPAASASVDPSRAGEKALILAVRSRNNAAIAAHDLEAVMAMVADDYVLTGGNSGIERSAAEDREAWKDEFARPGFDRYVRTPVDLEIGERRGVLRAAESGTWEGVDRKPAGEMRPFGRYFAHWSKVTGQWRVVSEIYVTLGCRGAAC